GSFFRQYVLLGDGELPPAFDLHGKVERAAIGRMVDGKLYYVVSRHKETMYDFADALREYGFTDAVYITGGNNYSFYRSPDGTTRINDETLSKIEKYSSTPPPAPLLVFRTALKN
ncbi:MAG: phosphodiester glycosidase family protein, partial [Muribaculaceae bacterium]|nr:phosphodiester glycosidase family protein [Muribaculaceae bacterium]